jgi:taurine dioxygenase
MPIDLNTAGTSSFKIQPLNLPFGVEIEADFNQPLNHDQAAELQRLFYHYGLIIARGQTLTPQSHIRLVEYIGSVPKTGQDGVSLLSNAADPAHNDFLKEFVRSSLAFHSDDAFSPAPARAISLYGMDVVANASGTQFISAVEACRRLPPALHARLQNLEALHVFGRYVERRNRLRTAETNDPHSFHPVLLPHPVTGAEILFVNYLMTDCIYGLSLAESEQLIEELFGYLYQPAGIYEHRWQTGDLLLWDNYALQHARGRVDPAKVGARKLHRVVSTDKGFMEMHPQFRH